MNIKFILCFILVVIVIPFGFAQKKVPENDSTKVYKSIETYSKKSKTGKFIHKLIFRPVKSQLKFNSSKKIKTISRNYQKHEGKIIRNIIIETLDPFGYSAENPNQSPSKGFEKFGNNVHIKSKKWTIRNQLLFKKNDVLDSLVCKESERLIRRQRYVRSVVIQPKEITPSSDSIDVSIRVLDTWSLIPNGAISGNQGNFEITERNFFGLGHEFENNFTRRFADCKNAYTFRYSINNVRNSFINTTLIYNNSLENNNTKSIRIERRFFSPLTRFAGGVFFENRNFLDSLPNAMANFQKSIFQQEEQDFWFGHAVQLFKGTSFEKRTTNFVTTLGYKKLDFIQTPSISVDPIRYFSNEEWFLGSIGLTKRKYTQDKYLFNFDIIEDIPYGKVYSITGGFQHKNDLRRAYFGARFSYGMYYNFGYLGTNLEWGSLINSGKTEETTFRADVVYFTPLLHLDRWKLRQFITSNLVAGANRATIIKDRISLSEQNGFSGFNNPLFNGTRKWSASFQTQTYAPGNWRGFHFNPFANFTFGLLGDETNKFFDSKLYSNFSLGLLINNDYLVFNSFQISISYYPSIPFEGSSIFRTNTLKNNDLQLPTYEIGQPSIVNFR